MSECRIIVKDADFQRRQLIAVKIPEVTRYQESQVTRVSASMWRPEHIVANGSPHSWAPDSRRESIIGKQSKHNMKLCHLHIR